MNEDYFSNPFFRIFSLGDDFFHPFSGPEYKYIKYKIKTVVLRCIDSSLHFFQSNGCKSSARTVRQRREGAAPSVCPPIHSSTHAIPPLKAQAKEMTRHEARQEMRPRPSFPRHPCILACGGGPSLHLQPDGHVWRTAQQFEHRGTHRDETFGSTHIFHPICIP
jgi:hypothetical protein